MPDTKNLFAIAETDDAGALAAALSRAPDTFRIRNEGGETLYMFCVFRGKAKCAGVLERRGGFSLHEAALAGDAARIDELAKAAPWGIDTLSPDGWPALHLAAFLGRDAALLRLLEWGADARITSRAFEQNLPIHAAAAGLRIGKDAFAALVAASGDPDLPQKQGYTALMIAAGNGFEAAVDILLAAGADKTRPAPDGKTAASLARERGHATLAARLE
jgi:ankyrin repeat protein